MKIAFIGKGGSGKTTVCALTARRLASLGKKVVAIDADINQHLASALGLDDTTIASSPKFDDDQNFIKNYLRGTNNRINPKSFFKTTPPGQGSTLIGVADGNPIEKRFGLNVSGTILMQCGIHKESDLGVHCYHGKTSVVDMILNHTVDQQHEFMLVDMTAGADAFSSTLFTRFDMMLLVLEPTLKSIGVLKQYQQLGKDFNLPLYAVANKILNDDDLDFINKHAEEYLIGAIRSSEFIRQIERGNFKSEINLLESENLKTIDEIIYKAQLINKNWDAYLASLIEIHRKIGPAWGGGAPKDLLEQIDPNFKYPEKPNWNMEGRAAL